MPSRVICSAVLVRSLERERVRVVCVLASSSGPVPGAGFVCLRGCARALCVYACEPLFAIVPGEVSIFARFRPFSGPVRAFCQKYGYFPGFGAKCLKSPKTAPFPGGLSGPGYCNPGREKTFNHKVNFFCLKIGLLRPCMAVFQKQSKKLLTIR